MENWASPLHVVFQIYTTHVAPSPVIQGLIVGRTQYLLHDPESNNIQNEQSVASMVGHEVAHMWYAHYAHSVGSFVCSTDHIIRQVRRHYDYGVVGQPIPQRR